MVTPNSHCKAPGIPNNLLLVEKHLPSVVLVKHTGYSLVEQLVVFFFLFFVNNLGDYELTMVFSPQNHWVLTIIKIAFSETERCFSCDQLLCFLLVFPVIQPFFLAMLGHPVIHQGPIIGTSAPGII